MKFFKVRKAEEQIHKVHFEAENAAECAKQLVKNFELYNHFSSEVSLGDMIETMDGNRFIVQDVMDFADKYEKEMKKESAVMQPNKPKPTTMLPDNMTWSWDPNAQDWVAVLKDNTNVTPPLYDPNNQNVVNQTTSYMSTVKSSSCLAKFLDGPQYSKEIKIEAGLIKEGLVKYAGFDFNRGTKYTITTKGLEVLRKASEAEHNDALNEREKLAYLFGFNTDEVSTLDTTGKVIKQSAKKWTICEADGTELGEVEADSELDAKVKFGIEHPEYADSQSISAKEIDAKYEETTESHEPYPNPSETPNDHIILENHDGWVNTAANNFKYTKEQRRLLPLFRLINDYVLKKEIILDEDPQNEYGVVATGTAEVINNLEHEVKDLGFYCEPVAQVVDNPAIGKDIYSLRIFHK